MASSITRVQTTRAVILRYGLAVASVAIALAPGLVLQHYEFHAAELPLFLFAVAINAWYGGVGPATLCIVLSALCLDYFFLVPLYSFDFTLADVPSLIVLVAFAALIVWFSSIRRRIERELRQARDQLQMEVVERTRQASLLNLTHDTIFVRDMSDTITYWNQGAQELYGWTPEQAIGKRSHEILRTVFPAPLDDIGAELLRTGRDRKSVV